MTSDVEREFTEFVTQHTHALVRMAHALTGDQGRAEDLVQTALGKAFARWRHIHGQPEFYVRAIVHRDFISMWRRLGRRRELSVANPPEPDPSPVDDQADLRLVLRSALLKLTPRQRAVLVLRFLEDLSIDETAQILGCHKGTVASTTSRALARLRELVPDLNTASEPTEALS